MSRICIVGAGPGSADLLTVRAARMLGEAGAVLYDRLVSTEVLKLAPRGAELHDVGKIEGMQEETQRRIFKLIEDCAARHDVVVRLKGGDPMVFGRGGEEWIYLASRGYEVDVAPGISSAIAVPELAGIPVTLRGISGGLAVVTGNRAGGGCQEWAAYAAAETLVVLMGVKRRAEIAECLMRCGRSGRTPVAFIENGTTLREKVTVAELDQVAGLEISSPAVMVVGEVVRMRQDLRATLDRAALMGV